MRTLIRGLHMYVNMYISRSYLFIVQLNIEIHEK